MQGVRVGEVVTDLGAVFNRGCLVPIATWSPNFRCRQRV